MRTFVLLFVLLFSAACFSEDSAVQSIVKLAEVGAGESLQLAYVDSLPYSLTIAAEDLILLKKNSVSDKVLERLLKHSGDLAKEPKTAEKATEEPTVVEKTVEKPVVVEKVVERPVVVETPVVVESQPVVVVGPPFYYPWPLFSFSFGWHGGSHGWHGHDHHPIHHPGHPGHHRR